MKKYLIAALTIFLISPSILYSGIAKDCRRLFDAKIKNEIGKEDCVLKCLALKVDMSNFQCVIAPYYCEEYCKSCRYPLLVRFDGTSLSIVKDCKSIIGQWRAVSGVKTTKKLSQRTRFLGGPMPAGLYSIDPFEISEPSLRRPFFLFNQRGWGKYRVPLHPFKETLSFGRNGFFIHGGSQYGSAGCIDLDGNEESFFSWLKQQRKSVNVEVRYD